MEKKCQVDDNVSSSDQISHGLASSISENKPSIRNLRDTEVSTVSSEWGHSSEHYSVRNDDGSGTENPLNEKRKEPGSGRVTEVSRGDYSATVPYPRKQLKADSSSSKESAVVAQLSSAGSVALNGSNQPTQSDESKIVFPEPESSITIKSGPIAATGQSSHCEFDLNEDLEDIGEQSHPKSIVESSCSGDALRLLEPIPVVAKVGVPTGLPKKPLQFGGEQGWRVGNTSAFRSTLSKDSDIEKETCGNLSDSFSKAPVCREFDLNIAATVDPEVPAEKSLVDISSQKPERGPFNGLRGTENCHRTGTSAINLNDNPMMDYAFTSIHRQAEAREVSRNCDAVGRATCSGGNASQIMSDCRSPYWFDLSSMQGYVPVQGQPLLLGAPAAEQVQMMVPIQLSNTPPGVYFGKYNGLTPTFYPSSVLQSLHNQQGMAAIPQTSGPVLAAYPGNVHLLESSQRFTPHPYASMRQTILPSGGVALVGNGSRGVNSAELLNPVRNSLNDERMKQQAAVPPSSTRRREADTGWGSSQMNCMQMASWN